MTSARDLPCVSNENGHDVQGDTLIMTYSENRKMDDQAVQLTLFATKRKHSRMVTAQGEEDNDNEDATTLNSSRELICRVMHGVTASRAG